jgi:hypothetical protein
MPASEKEELITYTDGVTRLEIAIAILKPIMSDSQDVSEAIRHLYTAMAVYSMGKSVNR